MQNEMQFYFHTFNSSQLIIIIIKNEFQKVTKLEEYTVKTSFIMHV